MYNLLDQSWKEKPLVLDDDNIRLLAKRIKSHLQNANAKRVRIILHGGEPILAGYKKLEFFLSHIRESLAPEIKIHFGMQTNATLITPEILDLLVDYDVQTGISLDGSQAINDTYRIDHYGRGSYERVLKGIELICLPKYRSIFSGFLCVINVNADPLEVYEHLASFKPKSFDFLFPDYTHNTFPEIYKGKTMFADWLIKIFDFWYTSEEPIVIRTFSTIIKLLLGKGKGYDSLGSTNVGLLVIETDGSIEGVDVLKATEVGGTLESHLQMHSFEELIDHPKMSFMTSKFDNLSEVCKSCKIVSVCGGGYLPHRFSSDRGFDNPSVYCQDLQKLIFHIYDVINSELVSLKEKTNDIVKAN